MMAVSTFSIFLALVGQFGVFAAPPIVHTSWGDIEGINVQDDQGNHLQEFLGIPFAVPPVGNLRFKKPVPHSGTNTTFSASKIGDACIQVMLGPGPKKYFGKEDCLTLNVYVPSGINTMSPRAVMVWIYGGGFFVGSGSWYDTSPLATVGDVITVTIQYRLGPFGFLSTMDDAAKGNYGLWDQLLALKWIKKHIGAFGGNPNQITIIGESAGAASVGFLTVSPEAKGLFRRAVLQSGSVTSSWAIKRNPVPSIYRLAERVGCGSGKDHPKLIECMRAVAAETLVSVSWPITNDLNTLLIGVPYGPVVDGEFIVADPHSLLMSPQHLQTSAFPSCDVMLGVNNNEGGDLYGGAAFYDQLFNTSLVENIKTINFYKTTLLPGFLDEFYGGHNSDMVETGTFEYLFPKVSDTIDLFSVFNTKTDAAFLAPAVEFARVHASLNGIGKTYLYYFDHNPDFPLPPEESVSPGMHHAFDLYYTFGFSKGIVQAMSMASNISSAEVALSLTFRNILTQFAKSGDPNDAVKNSLSGTWPQFEPTTEKYLSFSNLSTVRDHVAQRRVALWLELLPKLRNVHHGKPTGSGSTSFFPLPDIFG